MGETADLRNPLAGTFSLEDFLQQGDGKATIRKLLRLMLPTMDLKDFRRRFRIDTTSDSVAAGLRITDLRWTVPRGEAWRPLAILYENSDSAAHNVIVKLTLARGADSRGTAFMRIAATNILGNFVKLIWPLTIDNSGGASNWQSLFDFILEPGDSFVLEDLTVGTDPFSAQGTQFYYEVVPQPTQTRAQGVDGVVTIA